ncbi:hypothetical protein TRAPUB_8455 [Trametes pubescens]|uniref:F-box domain-containing protein n=1 Tax=Trametes pubescens TaxID=154538 RepID=A0A1M2W5H2_TRAPU|nr:hypothetical protein TRAPUB_8455 [Trametes pubescens]
MLPHSKRNVVVSGSGRMLVRAKPKPRSRLLKHISQPPSTPNRVATSHKTLPPEVLIQVFEHAVEADIATNSHLIRITHVCRYWRDLAVHSPALWTDIALRHPVAVKAFLARSKGLPLRICIDMNTTFFSAITKETLTQTLQTLLAQSRRTLTLKIDHMPPFGFDWVMKGIAGAAPQLEMLVIKRRLPVFVVVPEARPRPVVDGMPKLRSLTISGSALHWLPKAPNSLTEIELNNTLCDIHTMLDLLQRCSASLERLTIRGVFNTPPQRDTRRITLARLKTLQIHSGSVRGLAALLPSLVLPSEHTTMSFSCPQNIPVSSSHPRLRPYGGTFADLASALSARVHLPFAALRNLKRIELRWNRHKVQTLRAYLNSDLDDPAAPALQVAAYASHTPRTPAGARFIFNWPLDARHVETLDIYGTSADLHFPWNQPRRAPWGLMLRAVSRLRTLRIRAMKEEDLHALLCALYTLPVDLWQNVCPRLETLIFAEMALGEKSWDALVRLVHTNRTYLQKIVVELPKMDPAICDGWAAIQIRRSDYVQLVFTESTESLLGL